jgi:exodeoxyribonuclease VII, large subunit
MAEYDFDDFEFESDTGSAGKNAVTVTQLNEYIKMLIEGDRRLGSIHVKGEISNFTNHYKTGHFYFTIKDTGSTIKAVMFKSAASKLKFIPENGMKIIAGGRVSAYVRDGQYQFYAETMEPDGVGALYIAFEQLKRKLEAEGLFDPSVKKTLPKIPLRVGIITSPTGAAIRDMINISARRFPMAKITLYPTLVQGSDAPPQLIAGLEYFNRTQSADVIIIGRGGGSIEDLWAFNDEGVARAVYASQIPVISAVGHEIDFTICDFVADKRAPTPSAAAEIALPDTAELKRKINNIIGKEQLLLSKILSSHRQTLERYASSRVLLNPQNAIDDKRMAAVALTDRLIKSMNMIDLRKRGVLSSSAAKLDALNPLSVISRGYSAVFSEGGELIKSINQVKEGDAIKFKTSDGSVNATVNGVEPD